MVDQRAERPLPALNKNKKQNLDSPGKTNAREEPKEERVSQQTLTKIKKFGIYFSEQFLRDFFSIKWTKRQESANKIKNLLQEFSQNR